MIGNVVKHRIEAAGREAEDMKSYIASGPGPVKDKAGTAGGDQFDGRGGFLPQLGVAVQL
ncbi:MAG: hypothetical protein J0H34_16530 [Rhizobiales bacterium]|nr:hypothetical protein [Hyphomicrobiales bacterium]